jgi:hypothetical protein
VPTLAVLLRSNILAIMAGPMSVLGPKHQLVEQACLLGVWDGGVPELLDPIAPSVLCELRNVVCLS